MFALLIMGCLVGRCVTTSDASSSQKQLTRFTFTEYHMGIDARLTVYADTQNQAEKACRAAFDRIGALDWVMSDYRKDSELMKLCAQAGGPAVGVSPDLFKVFKMAEEVSRRSDGTFDITVGPLVALWRASRKSGVLPDPTELEKARALVGWEKVELNDCGRTVRLAMTGMKLDLGGIAKGYACDEAQKALRRHGVARALVEMGGDIVVSGPPPGRKGWTIRVPNAGDDKGPKDLDLANCAVSTSGDTEQFVIIGGVQHSHVIDPRTGQALTNRAQATIIAKEGLTSDPLSKVLTVLGEEKHARFLKKYRGVKSYLRILRRPGLYD